MLATKRHIQSEPSSNAGFAQPEKTQSFRSHLWAGWIYHVIRIILGIVFLWSGISKLFDLSQFAVLIDAYGLIPEDTVFAVALLLSLVEFIAGLGLIINLQWSLAVVAGLLVLFMVILGYGIWMGLDVDCGCFVPGDPEAEAYHGLRPALYRDLVMLAGAGYLFYWQRQHAVSPLSVISLLKPILKGDDRK